MKASVEVFVTQGEVTSVSCVEVFATGIKIESSDQSPFGGPIKVTSKLLKSTIKNTLLQCDL